MVKRVGQRNVVILLEKLRKLFLWVLKVVIKQRENISLRSINYKMSIASYFSKGNNTDPVGVVNDLLKGAKKGRVRFKTWRCISVLLLMSTLNQEEKKK